MAFSAGLISCCGSSDFCSLFSFLQEGKVDGCKMMSSNCFQEEVMMSLITLCYAPSWFNSTNKVDLFKTLHSSS